MSIGRAIELTRECQAFEVPSGISRVLLSGSKVRIIELRGSDYTITTDLHSMYRVAAEDADALGLGPPVEMVPRKGSAAWPHEQVVWNELRTIYDPHIEVNVVDLGLIYSCIVAPRERSGVIIEIEIPEMAADSTVTELWRKLSRLPEVEEVHIRTVSDPPWHPSLMSEAARLQLGFEVDRCSRPDLAQILR
jgi:metal-sulfur cluster biosynthetic enzyme